MGVVAAFGTAPAQLAMIGSFVSILGGLFLSYLSQEDEREQRRSEVVESLAVPLALAEDRDLFRRYQAICRGLKALGGPLDPILRDIALLKLASITEQVDELAEGRVTFTMTEGWRTVYKQILASETLRTYRSVAWYATADYWQDSPGRQSMEANYEAADRGVLIERVVILPDSLWPRNEALPRNPPLGWIEEQHNHGLWVTLVRESDLEREPDLLTDLGIYGDRAVGFQELDDRSRTLKFILDFTPETIRLAEDRWKRLLVYSASFRSLLDRQEKGR
jgi:hypothetical protein